MPKYHTKSHSHKNKIKSHRSLIDWQAWVKGAEPAHTRTHGTVALHSPAATGKAVQTTHKLSTSSREPVGDEMRLDVYVVDGTHTKSL